MVLSQEVYLYLAPIIITTHSYIANESIVNDIFLFYTEATHAYIKLHPNFSFSHINPLPHKVEEGLAQLVAHLFLSDGLCYRPNTNTARADTVILDESEVGENVNCTRDGGECETIGDDSIPSDEKLRQYFRFCIENDDGVYGEGFRLAASAYAKMGLQELLYYVALHHCFPPL